MPRSRRITILLDDDEAYLWDSVRNTTFPEGLAARQMLLDAMAFLASKGLQQRRNLHAKKQATAQPDNSSQEPDYWKDM